MEKLLQPLLADPSLHVVPSQLAFGHATPLGTELPSVQVLHSIERAKDAQRLEGGERVSRVAFDAVFVVAAGIGRGEIALATMLPQDAANALLAVDLVQSAEDFERGE